MKHLIQCIAVAVLALIGLQARAQALTFELPNRIAQQCDLVSRGDQVTFNFSFGRPDYSGVYYEGPLDGVTSSGVPVTCYATVSLRAGRHGFTAMLDADTMTIGDSCDFTNVKMRERLTSVDPFRD